MTWQQHYRLKQHARTSLVLWPTVSLFAALIVSPLVLWFDRLTGWSVFGFSADGARALLTAFESSMLTFIVFVLSSTLIVVQLASGQLTPRIVSMVFASPELKLTLGLFTFTFTYTLAALGRVEHKVSELHVGLAIVLNLACIIGFFFFVQRLSAGLRSTTIMGMVADQGLKLIELVYPLPFDPAHPESLKGELPASLHRVEIASNERSGVVMAFSVEQIVRLAMEADAVVELVPQVGDFVATGDPLFRVSGAKSIPADQLQGCVAIGTERTLDQDPRFVIRILVDIASRALSPGINDPTTAVLALDQIHHMLVCIGKRHLDEGQVTDRDGKLRLIYGTPDWPDYVMLAISEIRLFGEGSLQVDRRLKAILEHLIEVLHESRRPPLQEELSLLNSAIARRFPDETDRKRAAVADYQGVGGSDS